MTNKISINQCKHFIDKNQTIIIIEGLCNEINFSAINLYREGINSELYIFNDTRTYFSKSEYNSILRKSKSTTPEKITNLKNEIIPENFVSYFDYLFQYLEKKHYGEKIYLNSYLEDNNELKNKNAIYDPSLKKWFIFSKIHNKEEFLNFLK